jgi:hypothetical protein
MTRFLSEALQAREPYFRLGLQRLERVNGHPSHDIRLSTAVQQAVQAKLRSLGLDSLDTTGEELYHTLLERVKADDARLTKTLRTLAATHVSAEAEVVAGMVHALQALTAHDECFAIKATSLKALLRKLPPRKAMKQLGYRSLDSFLKHETLPSIMAAAWLVESPGWQQQLLQRYKRLKPADFENRTPVLLQPSSRRWRTLAEATVQTKRHNLLCFKELGAIVLLPLPVTVMPGVVTVSLMLALHELNEIRACSTYLKLCQVRPDFGNLVQAVVGAEPHVSSTLLSQPVSWHLIQHYYSRLKERFREELFEPHIRADDMAWQAVEQTLVHIEPRLEFWLDSAHLGLMHEHRFVSMNLLDMALNLCNRLPFERRITQACQRSLWHELLLKYLNHDTVEETVLAQLQPQLAAETVKA